MQAPMERRIKELQKEVRQLSGIANLDLRSTKEVGDMLFTKLKLPVPHSACNGKGKNPSTKDEVSLAR
jgi:DNA polymerase I-like protein with 3'-5' exonuclease and polymerase domains